MNLTPMYLPFPVDALPSSIGKAAFDVIHCTQAPHALVASSAIATASLSTQNLVDVERREHLVGPTGLFFITVCASGERKTTVDNLFTQSIREFDRSNDLEYQSQLSDYLGELAVWQVKKKVLKLHSTKRSGKASR